VSIDNTWGSRINFLLPIIIDPNRDDPNLPGDVSLK
jgi:hypothetical protein